MLEVIAAPFDALFAMRQLGGPVVDWIFACCLLMWTIVLERMWYFNRILPSASAEMLERWHKRSNKLTWASRSIRTAMISRLNAGMTSNMQVLRVLVPMSPLLGLIGTVLGMLAVFDSMSALGSADARAMATGVSEAMICTLTGLAVSISGLYPMYYFMRKSKRETERLSDKFTF